MPYRFAYIGCLAALVVCGLCCAMVCNAQYTVHVNVNDFHHAQQIFLMGSPNGWNPADKNYQLKRVNYYRWQITLTHVPAGKHTFKLSKGSYETLETTATGQPMPTRTIDVRRDTTVLFEVQAWQDDWTNAARFSDSAKLAFALDRGYHYLNTNADSSYKYALQTFALSATVSEEMKAYATDLQGEVLLKLGNTDKALEVFKEGLRIRVAHNDSSSMSYLYNQLGNVYWTLNDTASAAQYYRLAMRYTQPFVYDHPLHEAICSRLCNLGRVCLARHQRDSAKWYAAQAAAVGDKISTVTDLFFGDIAVAEGATEQALLYFRRAATHGIHHDNNLDLAQQAYERMSHMFTTLHQPDSALVYARLAFATANRAHNHVGINRSGSWLASLFEGGGRYDSAAAYQKQVIASMDKQARDAKERFTLDTYFTERLKQQDDAAKAKATNARLLAYVLLGSLALLIVAGIIYRIRLKSGYDKRMKEIEMRALRAQMNPHFVFNCLASINRYIVKSDTKTASNYLTKFAKLIRLILDNSASDHIGLDIELQTLQLYLDMESLRFDHGFDYEIEKDPNLNADAIHVPSMLIQPYVENAIWHGLLQKEEKGKLWVRFKKVNGHTIHAEIEDNGIGRKQAAVLKSKDSVKHKSYGMQISSDRIQLINSRYKLNNSISVIDLVDDHGRAAGTKIILNIPVS